MKRTLALSMLAALAALASACIFPLNWPGSDEPQSRGEVFYRVVALEPGGTLQLENVMGDIEIRGWDRSEVEISVEEDEDAPFRGRVWLSGRRPSVTPIEVDSAGPVVKIRADLPERERDVRSLHFYVSVPRSVNLDTIRGKEGDVTIADLYGKARVQIERGRVQIDNFSGSLDLAVGRGSVKAEVLDMRSDDTVVISAAEGDITLFLAEDAAARLKASAGGTVTSEFDLGRTLPARSVEARIGRDPAASIDLSAPKGSIRLLKSK
jgi:hypothetical protein